MKANYDEDGNLLLNKRRYRDFYNKKTTISAAQREDGALIQCSRQVAYYEPEYRDYIEDYRSPKPKNKKGLQYYKQQIFWDHVVVTVNGNVVIFESDDPSHRDPQYCLDHGYITKFEEFLDILERDEIKNTWAKQKNIRLIRIDSDLSFAERKELIDSALNNY